MKDAQLTGLLDALASDLAQLDDLTGSAIVLLARQRIEALNRVVTYYQNASAEQADAE